MLNSTIDTLLTAGKHAHLVGIGGVSMHPLAEVLAGMGMTVTGSDMNESASVADLRAKGIQVRIGHFADSVEGADLVIRTAAVHDDNPEIAGARTRGIPVFERAQAWGSIMKGYSNALCIAGTHGKTTTTSMSTHILMEARRDPTVMIGGTLPLLHAGHRVGSGDTIVLESCEYCNSFHSFFPTVAVILNVDADHLDFFSGIEDIRGSFRHFALQVPQDTGWVVANAEDDNTMRTLEGIDRRVLTFAFDRPADVTGTNLTWQNGCARFDVMYRDQVYTRVELMVPGRHNAINALAAAAAACVLGIPGEAVTAGLRTFSGAGRRFEYKGEYNGAKIYDDYAHHPGEMEALITMAKTLDYQRIILVFQPHTYTRTKLLFNEFAAQLSRVDVGLLAEIYAAREVNTIGVTSSQLAEACGARCIASMDEIVVALQRLAQPGDLILTVGAGDIYKVGEKLASLR